MTNKEKETIKRVYADACKMYELCLENPNIDSYGAEWYRGCKDGLSALLVALNMKSEGEK